jgi:hypothetical protein
VRRQIPDRLDLRPVTHPRIAKIIPHWSARRDGRVSRSGMQQPVRKPQRPLSVSSGYLTPPH